MIEVFSSGGGSQSCAISVLILQGKLPMPDYIVIVDTGKEMPTTWSYLDEIVRPSFANRGVEIHRILKDEYASNWGRGLFATSGDLMIPAYSNKNGGASKLKAFCSGAWKSEVVARWFSKTQGLTRRKYRKWIGFSFDETKRILAMQNGEEFKSGLIRFPLVHDVIVRRHEAVKIVLDYGWPKPPRSRCYDCPNQSDKEWAEVKNDFPFHFIRAIKTDEGIRQIDPNAFLHSSIKPLKDVDLSQQDDLFSSGCASGECFL